MSCFSVTVVLILTLPEATEEPMVTCYPQDSYLFLSFLKNFFLGVQLIYSVVLVSAVQQSESYTHTHTYMHTPPLLRYFPIQVNTEYWVEFPVLYSRSLLAIYLYTVVCMHQFQSPNLSLPPHPSPFQKIVAKYTKYKTDHFNRKSNSIKCIHTIVQTLPLSISRTFPSSSTGTLSSWSSNSPFSAPQPLAPTILLSVFWIWLFQVRPLGGILQYVCPSVMGLFCLA